MKAQFIDKLLSQPWHISPPRGRTLIGAMLQRLRSERPDEDVHGDPLPKLQIIGDVALIPLRGTLLVNVPDWCKAYGLGLTDANDIAEELDRAVNDPQVAFIVLDVDSPGGWSIAGDKLFDMTEAANRRKRVFGWAADGADAASSAYEAIAPCQAIYVGKHAMHVGCIGSYLAMLDDTEFWKMLGMTWEIFRSGEFKGMGEDALSETQRAYLQAGVDDAGARFRRNVKKYRTEIAEEDMQGQYYLGAESARRGFSAGLAKDLPAALTKFRALL